MRVPEFLVRQFYVAGSLRQEGDGFRLQARNGMGDGTLVGIGRIDVDGATIDPQQVTATREGDPSVHAAGDISPRQPISFRRGDVVTLHVAGHALDEGEHRFEVEIFERDLGRVTLTLRDRIRPAN